MLVSSVHLQFLIPRTYLPLLICLHMGTGISRTLSLHYGESKQTDDGLEIEPVVNSGKLKEEWVIFKLVMSKNFSSSTIQGMAQKVLTSSEMQEQFPQILKLLTLALTVPASSVDCERGFSKQNLSKTKIRAKLKTINVSTLMKMSIDSPDMEHFDFHGAFVIWCSTKDRVICRS